MGWLKKLLGIKDEAPPALQSKAKTQGSNFPPYAFTPKSQTVDKVVEVPEKSKLIEVEIQELKGLYLIVGHPTGVEYTHQCAGLGCFHPSLEGYLVPLEQTYKAEEELAYHFIDGCSYDGLIDSELQDIESIFKRHGLGWLSVDRNRLKDSFEAWVHVIVQEDMPCIPFCYRSNPRTEMILIWENSD